MPFFMQCSPLELGRHRLPNSYHTKQIVFILQENPKFPFLFSFVASRLFQKWCSSGAVSAFSFRETIDFTDFSGIFQDISMAHEKYMIAFVVFSHFIIRFLSLCNLIITIILHYFSSFHKLIYNKIG